VGSSAEFGGTGGSAIDPLPKSSWRGDCRQRAQVVLGARLPQRSRLEEASTISTRRRSPRGPSYGLRHLSTLVAWLGLGIVLYVGAGSLLILLAARLWMRLANMSEVPQEFVLGALFVWMLPLISLIARFYGAENIREKHRMALLALVQPSAATVLALLLPLLPSYNKRGLQLILATLAIITVYDFSMAYLGHTPATDQTRKYFWWVVGMGFVVALFFPEALGAC